MPKLSHYLIDDYDDNHREDRPRRRQRPEEPTRQRERSRPPSREQDQAFKCVSCRQFIGALLSGGRHRNHCPNCLMSRHVDATRPGDRKSECHGRMEPIGVVTRRNGEQMVVHRCVRCGKIAPNRVAADDNPLLLMRLPLIRPAGPRLTEADEPIEQDDIA